MASALNSVTPTSYFDRSSLSLRVSVSQIKRGDELSSIDLLASPQAKTKQHELAKVSSTQMLLSFPPFTAV